MEKYVALEIRIGSDDRIAKLFGTTQGCGCCSYEEIVSPQSLDEHIKTLKEDLKIALSFKKKIKII